MYVYNRFYVVRGQEKNSGSEGKAGRNFNHFPRFLLFFNQGTEMFSPHFAISFFLNHHLGIATTKCPRGGSHSNPGAPPSRPPAFRCRSSAAFYPLTCSSSWSLALFHGLYYITPRKTLKLREIISGGKTCVARLNR
jgi:hypothetical protein